MGYDVIEQGKIAVVSQTLLKDSEVFMYRYKKIFLSCLLAFALLLNTMSSFAQNVLEAEMNLKKDPPDPAAMIADLVIARPVGLLATIGGTAFFIVSVPFSALGGNTEDAWKSLVVSPASYTFTRPLGEFDD